MKPAQRADDARSLPLIKEIVSRKSSYGYRRVTRLLSKELQSSGFQPVNHKRVYRIMKANGMLLARNGTRPTRTHDGKIITLKSNLRCWNGDLVQIAYVLDCHDREVIIWISSSKGISGEMIRDS